MDKTVPILYRGTDYKIRNTYKGRVQDGVNYRLQILKKFVTERQEEFIKVTFAHGINRHSLNLVALMFKELSFPVFSSIL